MDLKTTTRPQRNIGQFVRLRSLLAPPADGRPLEILEVGPGLAVRGLGSMTREGVPGATFFRMVEPAVRRLPLPDGFYTSYETRELITALEGLPFRVTVADVNPVVVRVVGASMSGVATIVADFGARRPPALAAHFGRFDAIVAQSVFGRIADFLGPEGAANASDNLRELARPGGILAANGDIDATGFEPLAEPGFYRRAGGASASARAMSSASGGASRS